MALVFPTAPTVSQRYPVNPGTSGVSQWEWDGTTWNTVRTMVSLGTANQAAYNSYKWPSADGTTKQQLSTDGAGNLSWSVTGTGNLFALGIDSSNPFDDTTTSFPLVLINTTTSFTPSPSTNIIVFLGGVPQTPTAAYSVTGSNIIFTSAPPTGTLFYAVTTEVV